MGLPGGLFTVIDGNPQIDIQSIVLSNLPPRNATAHRRAARDWAWLTEGPIGTSRELLRLVRTSAPVFVLFC